MTAAASPDEREAALVAALLRKKDRARKDPAEFFDFCMRNEHTGQPLRIAPHQRVAIDFVMHHDRAVVRMPVGFSKTFVVVALALYALGSDPSERAIFVSASAEQAAMPLAMARDYIANDDDTYPELAFVFPQLARSPRRADAWQQKKIVVDREPGIRDASIAALGYAEGASPLPGRRISLAVVDDVLNEANTSTAASRAKLNRWFLNSVVDRLDAKAMREKGSRRYAKKPRIVVTNVPWNPGAGGSGVGDLTYELERAGWPTLTMDGYGDVTVSNADPLWNTDELRPARDGEHAGNVLEKDAEGKLVEKVGVYRLAAHDSERYGAPFAVVDPATGKRRVADPKEPGARPYDLDEEVALWPEKFPRELLEEERRKAKTTDALAAFLRTRRCITRDDETALVKAEWIEAAKKLAFKAGFRSLQRTSASPLIAIGVDLAFSVESRKGARSCFFVAEVIPALEVEGRTLRNVRRLVDVRYFRKEGAELKNYALELCRRYPNAVLRVETNGAQKLLRDWLLDVDRSLPIVPHTTGVNKHHRSNGARGVFLELENGAWLIPSEADGSVEEPVKDWIQEVLDYRPPPAHTPDGVIAVWLARAQLRAIDLAPDDGAGEQLALAAAVR